MNSPTNRQPDSPHPPEPPIAPQRPPANALENAPANTSDASEGLAQSIARKLPISPPSHPQQYRAIGLIRGIYEPSAEQMTKGTLTTTEGTPIDSVLLGRLISLIKNHIDLTQEHLWVVYPRTRQTDNHLHVQIVGVWEPETLDKDPTKDSAPTSPSPSPATPDEIAPDEFFSIRGEAVYASNDKQVVILKIRQAPKKETEEAKYFKIKLKGTLSDRPIGHFWELTAQLHDSDLVIQEANDLGMIKKKPLLRSERKRPFQQRDPRPRSGGDSRPKFGDKPNPEKRPVSKPIINKPTKSNIQPKDAE
jgi:hypothetical protein